MEVQISPKWEKKGTVLTLNIWGKLGVSPFHPEKMVIWRAKIVILTQQTWWFHRLNHGDPPNMVLWKVLVEYSWGFWGYMTNGYMWEVRWKIAALNQQNFFLGGNCVEHKLSCWPTKCLQESPMSPSNTQTWPIFTPARYQNSHHKKNMTNHDWLVVLTILKNMSQWEGLPSGKLSHNYGKSPCDSW